MESSGVAGAPAVRWCRCGSMLHTTQDAVPMGTSMRFVKIATRTTATAHWAGSAPSATRAAAVPVSAMPIPSGRDSHAREQPADGERREGRRERQVDAGDVQGDEEDAQLGREETDHAQREPLPGRADPSTIWLRVPVMAPRALVEPRWRGSTRPMIQSTARPTASATVAEAITPTKTARMTSPTPRHPRRSAGAPRVARWG